MTAIEWTHHPGYKGETWNPSTGCDRVSPGCAHCYAAELAPKLRRFAQALERKAIADGKTPTPGKWLNVQDGGKASGPAFEFTMHRDALDLPLRQRAPRCYFVNSMSDLFHERMATDFLADVFAVMSMSPQHRFLILTKRAPIMAGTLTDPMFWLRVNAARMRRGVEVLPGGITSCWPTGRKTLPNVWLGVTVENRRFVERADWLRVTPAAVRFVSAEPLLGPLDDLVLGPHELPRPELPDDAGIDAVLEHERQYPPRVAPGLDWVIVGGESGPKHRRFDQRWARDLRDACAEAGVAFFVKQLGGRRPGGQLKDLPDDLRIRELPPAATPQLAEA